MFCGFFFLIIIFILTPPDGARSPLLASPGSLIINYLGVASLTSLRSLRTGPGPSLEGSDSADFLN